MSEQLNGGPFVSFLYHRILVKLSHTLTEYERETSDFRRTDTASSESRAKRETSQQFNGSTTALFQMAGLCQKERTGKKHKKKIKK